MLVIKKRGAMRRYRYGGSGIVDIIMQKMFSSGVKSVINRGVNSMVAQKVANAVVNGATSAAKKTAERVVNEAINTATPYVKEKLIGKKRTATAAISTPSAKRININSLIDGSGIVLD